MSDIENETGLDMMMESDNEETNDKQIEDLPAEENESKSEVEAADINDDEDDEPAGLDLGEVLAEAPTPVSSGSWIKIANLMRPFTPMGLKKKITDSGGEIADAKTDFWLNNIKSVAFVKLSNHAEVHPKVLEEMNGQTWPESSIKQLELTVVDQVEKDNAVTVDQGGHVTPPKPVKAVVVDARAALDKRANDHENRIKQRSRSRSPVKNSRGYERRRSPTPKKDETPRQMNTDSIDALFKKTTSKPHIYWKPKKELTTE
jgi:hypothetical protein